MKALILTQGTRGDVQPFAALARALEGRGHEVILGAPSSSLALAGESGIKTLPFQDVTLELMADRRFRAAYESRFRGLRGRHVAVAAVRSCRERVLTETAEAGELGADVIVHHTLLPGNEIAERLGVPSVPVCLLPVWVPTSAFPNPRLSIRPPAALNRASYAWTQLRWRTMVGGIEHWRRQALGLPRRRGHRNMLRRPDGGPATVLQAFSARVLPAPLDYPGWVHTTGFWFLPSVHSWRPPEELARFLADGRPTVYIGFGSSAGADPGESGRLIADAVRRAGGVRAVVVGGWGGIAVDPADRDVLYLDDVPFEWLFPKMSAIVHHGGGGTTGAALAAGRPQVVCPFGLGQEFWASRMRSIGVAPEGPSQQTLTADGLARAIRQVVTDPRFAVRAEKVGEQIRAENGVLAAIRVLESVTARNPGEHDGGF